MNFASLHFLTSGLTRLRSKRKERRTICPNCRGYHTDRVNRIEDEEGCWRKERYLCHDCDCEWEWTYQRPFFHWRRKIRAPGWVRLE